MRLPRLPFSHAGSSLLLVLWAILLLSAAIMTWASWLQHDMELAAARNNEVEARAMALSGIALGKHPLTSERTPALEEQLDESRGFRVRIIGEGAKLNINWLLEAQQPVRLSILKFWLESHGLNFEEREKLVDCLLDSGCTRIRLSVSCSV